MRDIAGLGEFVNEYSQGETIFKPHPPPPGKTDILLENMINS